MSRSADADNAQPTTPRATSSSSSLFATFRVGLNNAKLRPTSPSGSSVASPLRTPDSTTGGLVRDGELSSPAPPYQLPQPRMVEANPVDAQAIDVSGAAVVPALEPALRKLGSTNTPAARISAVNDIVSLLDNYTGANVVEVWRIGCDLIQPHNPLPLQNAGYSLLIACVRHKRLTSHERQFFFGEIPTSESPDGFSLRFQVLVEITEDGKYLESLETFILPRLARLMQNCFKAAQAAKKKKLLQNEQDNLDSVLDFLLNVIKHSSHSFTEKDLDQLMNLIYPLCADTTSVSDIRKSIDIVDALVTYSCLPQISINNCLRILCGTYSSIKELKAQSWRSIQNLLHSHLGSATIDGLLQILKKNPNSENANTNISRGAVQIIRAILAGQDQDLIPQSSLPKVISATRQSLAINSARVEADAMALLLDLIDSPDPVPIIFHDKVWTNAALILSKVAQRPPVSVKQEQEDGTEVEIPITSILQRVADRLLEVTADVNPDQRRQVMRLLMIIIQRLEDPVADEVIQYLSDESLLYPFNEGWDEGFQALFNNVFKDQARSLSTRLSALQALYDAYNNGEALGTPQIDEKILEVIRTLKHEKDASIVNELASIAVNVATWTSKVETFDAICLFMRNCLEETVSSAASATRKPRSAHSLAAITETSKESSPSLIAKGLVRMFLRIINRSAWKTEKLYELFLEIARSNNIPPDARIMAFKVLFRLRADINHGIFLVTYTECEGIAAALCRTDEISDTEQPFQNLFSAQYTKTSDRIARRSAQDPTNGNARLPVRPSTAPKDTSLLGRPTPPLWLYPGPKGLPEEPPYLASPFVCSLDESLTKELSRKRIVLRIGAWLELLLEIFQEEELEWEVYSYILAHLGSQLINHALFADSKPQICFLRNVICDQLTRRKYHEPPPSTNLRKHDVAICLYHILTMLVTYHEYFSTNEEADIVKIMTLGIGSRERTSEICIHGLMICCHELPVSVTRSMEIILQKMSQIITQTQVAVHVLEFLATLARLPELVHNLRQEDFKTVFGICFRYLQSIRDTRTKQSEASARSSLATTRPATMSRNDTSSHMPPTKSSLSEDLPQYVYTLAYHVMVFWFVALRLQDRAQHVPWISKNLVFTDPTTGREVTEPQALVTMDLMNRVMYSDRDETVKDPVFALESDGTLTSKSWIIGMSILTIETASRSGISQTIRRRPSSTRYSVFQPRLTRPPRHQVPVASGSVSESYYADSYIGLIPDHILQEIYSPLNLSSASALSEMPIPLPQDDPAIDRALAAFDRISPLDGHRIGIIYVGEAQTHEAEILSNVMGSSDYTAFLRGIGTLVELKGATFNTQGLDRENDIDGKFTFAWRDRVSEIVFLVTTMMPTNIEHDPTCIAKKSHIGNNFVNIIFNNSGMPYKMETIPSEFNYVNIVITPEARASFVETRLAASKSMAEMEKASAESPDTAFNPYSEIHYLVSVQTASHMPPISPAPSAIPKLVSGKALAAFVRLVALNASVFCHVWKNRSSAGGEGEHVSSWRSRLQAILRLRERYGANQLGWAGNGGASFPGNAAVGTTPAANMNATEPTTTTSSNQLQVNSNASTQESAVFRRPSAVNINSETSIIRDSIGMIQENVARLSGLTSSSSNTNIGTESGKEIERESSTGSIGQ